MARYVLGPTVFAELRRTAPDRTGEVQLADALRVLIARGERVVAVPLAAGERRHDIGTIESYCSTFLRYALTDPRFGAELREQAGALLHDALSSAAAWRTRGPPWPGTPPTATAALCWRSR